MTEEEARTWIRERFGVPRETSLDRFAQLLRNESENQNLIARSTLDEIWSRHFVDSAQLIPLARDAPDGIWLDVGSGAGLPGMVVAALSDRPVVLAEPRGRRVAFLRDAANELGLASKVTIHPAKIESYQPSEAAAVVSARAVAELSQLLASTVHCTDLSTIWVLPKGRNAQSEVVAAEATWQGVFHVEPSLTQLDSDIVVARGVLRK